MWLKVPGTNYLLCSFLWGSLRGKLCSVRTTMSVPAYSGGLCNEIGQAVIWVVCSTGRYRWGLFYLKHTWTTTVVIVCMQIKGCAIKLSTVCFCLLQTLILFLSLAFFQQHLLFIFLLFICLSCFVFLTISLFFDFSSFVLLNVQIRIIFLSFLASSLCQFPDSFVKRLMMWCYALERWCI